MKCENGDLRTQLENSKKRKERNTSRRMAWLITNQSPRSRYEQEKAEQEAKKQEQEQRRQEKEAWDIEEAAYIAREAADRVFGSFASYKVRCALIILARALGLSAEGTNIVLTAHIKDHLQANEQSLDVPGSRFAGLFRSGRGRAPQGSCPVPLPINIHAVNNAPIPSSSTLAMEPHPLSAVMIALDPRLLST